MTSELKRIRRVLNRARATLAMALFEHDYAGCCQCGAADVRMITFDREAGVDEHGVPFAQVWTYCPACADELWEDDDRVADLAEGGVTWYMLEAPVTSALYLRARMLGAEERALPFWHPRVSA